MDCHTVTELCMRLLVGLLLAIAFDQVHFGLAVEWTNCLLDLEQAGGSLGRSDQLIRPPLPLCPSPRLTEQSLQTADSLNRVASYKTRLEP